MARCTILYVEDEEYDVLFMRRAFEQTAPDHQLNVVNDGQKAIEYLSAAAQTRPDLVLLDLNLPLLSGFEVLTWIRQHTSLNQLPVVIFSSSARQGDRVRAEALGASEYIQKPSSALDFSTVVQAVNARWLSRPSHARGHEQRNP